MHDNNCRIHETVLRDVLDILMDLKDQDEIQIFANKDKVFKSAASAAKDLTLVFPVLCSKNVTIDNASMVTKAIERKAATLLQLLFTAHSITDKTSGVEFIKQFHTNVDFGSNDFSVDKFVNAIDVIASMDEASIELPFNALQMLQESVKQQGIVLDESLNPVSLMEYKVSPANYRGEKIIQEAPLVTGTKLASSRDPFGDLKNYSTAQKDLILARNDNWLPTDVKKANELVPTMMTVNFFVTKGDNLEAIGNVVIGIKAKLYPVDSQDIMNHVTSKVADNNWLHSLIRATTKEISFWKDFVFALDKAKLDALSNSKRGSASKMWKVLERRALKSRIRRGTSTINDALAISTLVISQEEVEMLKKFNNINIEQPKVVRVLMEAYNLMSVVIVDEAMEVCKFVFDTGDDTYETIAFNLLEREASDNTYKKIVNLMTKSAR